VFHFFPRYTKDATDTPFGSELRRLGVPHRFFGAVLSHRYRSKLELLLVVHTKLLWFAVRNAWLSLVVSKPAPAVVVITSDVEALVFGFFRWVLRRRVTIVFETFIFVPRSGKTRALHQLYIATALRAVDIAICHSHLEVENCRQRFNGGRTRFAFVPFGTTLSTRISLMERFGSSAEAGNHVVSAGKSGRDYSTLAQATKGLPCQLRIVCDFAEQTASVAANENVEILNACYGGDYLDTLAGAKIVAIPLAVNDVSAGQMVLLQAFALKKPVIITRTPTTEDYATDGEDVLMVPMHDVAAMRDALQRLLSDADLRHRLAEAGARRFVEVYSTEAYVRNFISVVEAERRIS
jgi:glycosyltransferase involved in cell wall biosynthesis